MQNNIANNLDLQIFCMQIIIIAQEKIMSHPHLHLSKQMCHRLYMASNSIIRAYREPLQALNITYPQYIVMMALWEKDEISIACLLERTAIDGSAMTQILKKMTGKGLLQIVPYKHDKRKRFVKLTQQGQALKDLANDIPEKIKCRFTHIDAQQAQQLMDLLDIVVTDLNESEQ